MLMVPLYSPRCCVEAEVTAPPILMRTVPLTLLLPLLFGSVIS